SIEPFHLVQALGLCAGHLQRFGGHKHAAGLAVEAGRIEAFSAQFDAIARERLANEDLTPRFRVDALVRPNELDERAVEAVEALGPFGNGNPTPVFASRRLEVSPKVLQNKRAGAVGHLKLRLEGAPRLDAIGFSMA